VLAPGKLKQLSVQAREALAKDVCRNEKRTPLALAFRRLGGNQERLYRTLALLFLAEEPLSLTQKRLGVAFRRL
jgi:hypothetical protein